MKRGLKKNQVMIAALAVMIAAAGYLNYTGRLFGTEKDDTTQTSADLTNQELLDISEEDTATGSEDILSNDSETEGTPGEAVLTNTTAETTVAQAKVSREQVMAQSKETLQSIIDNKNLSDEQKQDAVDQMVALTKRAELEADIMPIDGLISFAGSDMGAKVFGADGAKNILAHAKERKAAGAKYCDCPACAACEALLDQKDKILK